MIIRGNASSTNWNVALFTVEITLFGCVFGTCGKNWNKFTPFKWHHFMVFGFIQEMASNTTLTKVEATYFAVKCRTARCTQLTSQDILCTCPRVHGLIVTIYLLLQTGKLMDEVHLTSKHLTCDLCLYDIIYKS